MGVTRSNACRLATGPTVFTTIASHSDCPCGGLALLGEYSVKLEAPDYTLLFNRVGGWAERNCAFRFESIIELLTFRYALDDSREGCGRTFTNLRNPYVLSRCGWNRSLHREGKVSFGDTSGLD